MSGTRELLAQAVELIGGDERPGQVELAEAVERAMTRGEHLLAEAPTGSGKSLAYLAPAVASGKKVVVATSTIALQDQLWTKDLPLMARAAGPIRAAVLKGRSQYVCLAKLETARGDDALFDERPTAQLLEELERVERFAEHSDSGDVAEIESFTEAVSQKALAATTCTAAECPGPADCPKGEGCFAVAARLAAEYADILVVNHALYCMHIASEGNVLPEHDVVVFDEAHALADTAATAFGAEISPVGLRVLAARLNKLGADPGACEAIRRQADAFADRVGDLRGRIDPQALFGHTLATLDERIGAASASLEKGNDAAERAQVVKLASSRRDTLHRFMVPNDDDVVWVERGRGLKVASVDPGVVLCARLLGARAVILTSATLGTGDRFDPLARRLGLDPTATTGPTAYRSLRLGSPFDHATQAMLYVPVDLPPPNDPGWTAAADDEISALVAASGGRALVLCTSNAAVERISSHLRTSCGHEVLSQGSLSKRTLIQRFVADETSVLVATRSFWVGIDAPGVACVLVAIDRIPFSPPDDPMLSARRERAGSGAFRTVDLPDAALILAQGAGRLIRSRDDRGVVCVLDRRLARADYRKVLLDALPPMRRSISRDDACAFLADAVSTSGRSICSNFTPQP